MNQMSELSKEEQQVFTRLFGTTDFGFAAYLMVVGLAELKDITPLAREARSPVRPLQFQFGLKPVGSVTIDDLRTVETDYINQKTQVEPIAYYSMRRRLHERLTRMLDTIQKNEERYYDHSK